VSRVTVSSVLAATAACALAACAGPTSGTGADPSKTVAVASSEAMASTLKFLNGGLPDLSGKKIAYLAECATENAYCQTRWNGAQDAASQLGADVVRFDAAFDPAAQRNQTQTAIQRNFDGYVLAPVADASGCATFKLLQATGKPVVNINSPMCGNPDYTDGTVGFVGMQTQTYFEAHVDQAFASCQGRPCKAVAVGGFVGSDLFTRWESAIKSVAAKYPNVTLVADQPGNFDPKTALAVVQDALTRDPDVDLVISSWDDMTRGVEQAIVAAGRKPGSEVRIFSVGGTKYGLDKVKAGIWTETSVLLPREESYYGFLQLGRALATGDDTPGFTYLAKAPVVTDGPKSIFITAANAADFQAEY
jgi:ABC-type sugar transport system substrate-binding protein